MKVNGTNYYIGRSQSGSYITSDSRLSTRLNTHTSSGYSARSNTYTANIYTIIFSAVESIIEGHTWNPGYTRIWEYQTHTSTAMTTFSMNIFTESYEGHHRTCTWYTDNSSGGGRQTLTSTSNVYYTTIITNGVSNITVSTTKSASSSSHNFV